MIRKITFLLSAFVMLLHCNLYALDKYKEYRRPLTEDYLLKISFSEKNVIMTIYGDEDSETIIFNRSDVRRTPQEIYIKDIPVINKNGFILSRKTYPVDIIDRLDLKIDNSITEISFLKRDDSTSSRYRSRKKNSISIMDDTYIDISQFVRGSVAGFWGNIRIDGEVNEDVVAVFGDIEISDGAVVRGDVVAIGGKAEVSDRATVYGEVLSTNLKKNHRFDRWRRWQRRERDLSAIVKFHYNRVDGATPYLGMGFRDEDSLLPDVEIYAGYGFSSGRFRYNIGSEQSFFLSHPITIGGALYKRLASQDDRLISETDNTIFALLATEDYKDYYEAEGGYAFGRFTPFREINFELGILAEKYRWLDAHKGLWSLFGGSKRFPDNFSGVPKVSRPELKEQIDDGTIASVIVRTAISNQNEEDIFEDSFWKGFAELEWTPREWNDDYDFTRYMIRITRYQTVNRYTGLIISAIYGDSHDKLPWHRKFFLGGLGTLHGYRHKEYFGTEFWLGDIEYRMRFPRSDLSGWVFYNIGQIADHPQKLSDSETKHSLGVGLSYEDEVRVCLARRLDRSDSSFKIYVNLGIHF
jgi:hypothetical protein